MIKIYNSLSKQVEEFKPMHEGQVNMFVCGPTVYDYIHAGNARTAVVFDVVAKYLRYSGYKVNYIQNITDIDDKIITRAKEHNRNALEYAREYENRFLDDMRSLHVNAVSSYARATDHLHQVTTQVQTLIDKGHVYFIEGDGYYFDLSTFPEYGKLSGRTALGDDDAVSRIDENDRKRNPGDFCVWKLSKEGAAPSERASPTGREPSWPSHLGKGRPGWHIEDTAITEHYFGPQYDLHGGGRDLIFPHHEAEITQQESASGLKPFVRYWMHAGFLEMSSSKMSKSTGNFRTAHDLLQEYSAETLRLYLLSAHYRAPLELSESALHQAEAGIMRIGEFMDRLKFSEEHAPLSSTCDPELVKAVEELQTRALTAMNDDFNTPQAIASLFDLLRLGNHYIDSGKMALACAGKMLELLDFYHAVLGIIPIHRSPLPETVRELANQRQAARDAKDFEKSDKLRAQIAELGWQVDDTLYGPLIKKSTDR